MSKVLGIIIEYNPFHNGHLYHINKAKELIKSEYVVGVMSGNFVQRGEPAILNKWSRTKLALKHGVDLVIELPTVYATQSAEGFALGAVHLLANSGVVTDLVFGSESGDITKLYETAHNLLELENNSESIKQTLKKGMNYNRALTELLDYPEVLMGSNNILGLEYLKNIIKNDLKLNVSTITRINNKYNDTHLSPGDIASATALRPYIKKNDRTYEGYMTKRSFSIIDESFLNIQNPGDFDVMSDFLFALLYRQEADGLKCISRIEPGLENRIMQKASTANTISELLEDVKSKRFSKSRLSRLLLHFILNIKDELVITSNYHPGKYIRILGCNQKGLELLNQMKKTSKVPFSLNYKKLLNCFAENSIERNQLLLENRATNIYTNFFYKKPTPQLEFICKPIINK